MKKDAKRYFYVTSMFLENSNIRFISDGFSSECFPTITEVENLVKSQHKKTDVHIISITELSESDFNTFLEIK